MNLTSLFRNKLIIKNILDAGAKLEARGDDKLMFFYGAVCLFVCLFGMLLLGAQLTVMLRVHAPSFTRHSNKRPPHLYTGKLIRRPL